MEKIQKMYIGEEIYYLSNDIKEVAQEFYRNCRYRCDIVKRKRIPEEEYCFGKLEDNEWIIVDGSSDKWHKLFISQKWVEKNIPEFSNNIKYDIEMAPEIIDLEDEEKFTDNDGNIIEIETRGEREVNKCYFLVKDVMIGFRMDNLHETLIDTRRGYQENIDYVYFSIKKTGSARKNVTKKELFLTYFGLLRVLFVSRSGEAHKFINWATNTLFTLQFGTKDQKTELVADTLGVTASAVKQVFNTSCSTTPSIYLFTLGTVKDLRKSMNIGKEYYDDSIVAKFGMTIDLPRRTGEHMKTYSKIKGVDLKIKHHSYIDPQYISSAETDLKNFFNGLSIDFEFKNFDELIILPKRLNKVVNRQFELLSKSYMGHISELITRLKDKDHEIKIIKYECDSKIKDNIHENELLKKENELLKKELEYQKMQNELNILKSKKEK
jgi:hypothetical protein